MDYQNTLTGIFLSRPNRFLARVLVNGTETICHVKNTGRLRELLIPGVRVILQFHPDAAAAGRKTEYSLIGVEKSGSAWVNIDSQAPNLAAFEWLSSENFGSLWEKPAQIRREVKFGGSRFDLAFTSGDTPWFMEVKGVTLDVNGTAMFPDAPTERGIKHLEELARAVTEGYEATVLFVIQMKGISAFAPNRERHPAFADALLKAREGGVHILARDCVVTESTMTIDQEIPVVLS